MSSKPEPEDYGVLSNEEEAEYYSIPALALKHARYFTGRVHPRWLREVVADAGIRYQLVTQEKEVYDENGPREMRVKTFVLFPDSNEKEVRDYLLKLAFKYFGVELPGDLEDLDYQQFQKVS